MGETWFLAHLWFVRRVPLQGENLGDIFSIFVASIGLIRKPYGFDDKRTGFVAVLTPVL